MKKPKEGNSIMKMSFKPKNPMTYWIHATMLIAVLNGCSDGTPETETSRPPSSLVLVNGNMIDGTGSDLIQDAAVVVRKHRIVIAGKADSVKIPEGAKVIDLKGATILPGFINTHVHFAYDKETLRGFAQAGVTTVRDLQDS